MIKCYLRSTLLVALLALCFGPTAQADTFSASEVKLKIALLYNFAKFIDWPDKKFSQPNSPVTLCIFAEESYLEAANGITNKPVQKNRSLAVITVIEETDLSVCHIAFLSKSTLERLQVIPASLLTSAILTVGESEKFITQGGIINLIEIDKKIRFEINMKTADALSLKISSKLLRLAKEVY